MLQEFFITVQGQIHLLNGVQVHDFWEELYIIEGSLIDLRLNEEFTAGMVACRPPGMEHGPWKSPDGCKIFRGPLLLQGTIKRYVPGFCIPIAIWQSIKWLLVTSNNEEPFISETFIRRNQMLMLKLIIR
ncbi:hypothetical protein RCO48_36750 [Peribacillus frigoritolerans]|nr:hypothetical protein [Peribacillus frigoritolerans]